MWKRYRATDLATPEAFDEDPGMVWQFYAYRRHMALQAQPNPAHFALADLAKKKTGFACLSQNVDGTQILFHIPYKGLDVYKYGIIRYTYFHVSARVDYR